MLSPEALELIHGEVDGVLSPAQREACHALLASNPEAAALAADLRRLDDVFAQVPARDPSPALQAALAAIPAPSRPLQAAAPAGSLSWHPPRAVSLFTLAVRRMEEVLMSRKLFLIGATAAAVIAVVAGNILPIPPSGKEVGTIGGDEIAGVQKAGRYRGRTMSEKDVSVSNPEIAVLFQNQDIVTLVKSGAFREAMQNDVFRELQANESFRQLLSNEAFRELMNSEAYAKLEQNEAYRELMANEVARKQFMSDVNLKLAANDVNRVALGKLEAYRELLSSDVFRQALSSDVFREVMSNEAYRQIMANDAYRQIMSNDVYRQVLASAAFRELQNSEAYRVVARNAQLSELFLNEAARMR